MRWLRRTRSRQPAREVIVVDAVVVILDELQDLHSARVGRMIRGHPSQDTRVHLSDQARGSACHAYPERDQALGRGRGYSQPPAPSGRRLVDGAAPYRPAVALCSHHPLRPCQLTPSPMKLCQPVADSPAVQVSDARAHGEHIKPPSAEDQESPPRVRVARPRPTVGVFAGHGPAADSNAGQAVPSQGRAPVAQRREQGTSNVRVALQQ